MEIPGPHRSTYLDALDRVRAVLGELAHETRQILTDATAAVAGPDAGPLDTDRVHAAVTGVRDRCKALDDELIALLAREAPVAGDLRLVVAAFRAGAALERMAELADHVAAAADRRAPAAVVPLPLRPVVVRLGSLCANLAELLVTAVHSPDVAAARRVEDADQPIDEAHRQLMTALTDPAWPHGVEAAVDLALLSRFYERFADQAVTAARQIARAGDPDRPA